MALNQNELTVYLKDGQTVSLTENEGIILERMRDADDTEYVMVFSTQAIAAVPTKFVPRDQTSGLLIKGLVRSVHPMGFQDRPSGGVELTNKGREVWAQISMKPESAKPSTAQYSELTEDELIELAAQKAEDFLHSSGDGEIADELASIALALKIRRDIAAPARRRIGEYLRQQAIAQAEYDRDRLYYEQRAAKGNVRYSFNKKPPTEELDEIRADEWAGLAKLLLTDLQRVAAPLVRDTETEYFEEQERRLDHVLKHNPKLPEKQVELLRQIAKGYVNSYGSGGYGSSNRYDKRQAPDGGFRIDGRVMNALKTRGLVDALPAKGFGHTCLMRIKQPK